MTALLVTLGAGLLAGLATWALTRVALTLLSVHGVADRPNERSSHDRPTPTGGGIVVVGVVLSGWVLLAFFTDNPARTWIIAAAAAGLAVVSFIDDVRGLPPLPRFAAHVSAVALGLALLPDTALLFGGLAPPWADRLVTGIAWTWFINLFNFMDGIDGITGVETITVAGGLALAVLLMVAGEARAGPRAALAAVLVGAAAGFLVHNWHPARLFLGDAGSVPLGYLLGWLLAWSACVEGLWWLALVLPLYYWVDATATLLARAARGEKIWRAHRQHAYQVAVQAGASHADVAGFIALLNGALVLLALSALAGIIPVRPMIILAVILTLVALWRLHHGLGKRGGLD